MMIINHGDLGNEHRVMTQLSHICGDISMKVNRLKVDEDEDVVLRHNCPICGDTSMKMNRMVRMKMCC